MALFNPLLRVTAGLEELYRTIEAQRPPPRPLSPHDVYSDDEDDAINFVPIGAPLTPRQLVDDRATKQPIPTDPDPTYDTIQVGTRLAHRYIVEQSYGQGTFSTVYLARDTYVRSNDSTPHDEPSPHRLVAIKVARKGHQAMIQAEYQRLRKLELHSLTAPANSNLPTPSTTPFPNMFLLAYHAFRLVDGCYCFAMDALIGGPVSVKAYPSPSSNAVGLESTSEAFRINQIRKIAVQIIGALGVLHRHRLIHADIKPDNILRVAPDSHRVRLVDFGSAVSYCDLHLYYTNFEIQTFGYRAPEVLFGVPFDRQIDMWSLGCTLFELFTERLPFTPLKRSLMVEAIVTLLGPVANRYSHANYAGGRFAARYEAARSGKPLTLEQRIHRLAVATGACDREFLDFLARLLEYDPTARMSPRRALAHPFVQRLFPFAAFLD